ncbi:hypothetical protein [Pseudorhodoferax sp. Leaf267]|uniref:hypothetical protein n=1 Tax=Pseudorhodoferax sp. Leaf267 TaxID=1736316 RepID=UPI000701449D|nr:hypothetical protein [Pseudorhodoferax sp. Leaf267]KQP22893.1 hypothetical protein ASF43_03100 [Pseudorhodoferax sp. Leaf267]
MTIQYQSGNISQHGGVTRVTHGQEDAAVHNPMAEAFSTVGRFNSPTLSVNMRTGETEAKGRTTYNAYEDQASRPGVMASFQPYNGGTVVVEGMRTSVANAVRMGAVRADGHGGFMDVASLGKSEATTATTATPDPLTPPEADKLPSADHFDDAEWQAFETDIADMPQPVYDKTVAVATLACLDGTDLDAAADRLAREGGMDPARAQEHVQSAFGMFRDAVVRSVAAEGVSPAQADEFFAWCRGQRGLQGAISSLTVARDVKPFQHLAREYAAKQARAAGVNQ